MIGAGALGIRRRKEVREKNKQHENEMKHMKKNIEFTDKKRTDSDKK